MPTKKHKEIYVIVDAGRNDTPVIAFTKMPAAQRALEIIQAHEDSYPFPGSPDQVDEWVKNAPYGEEHLCVKPTIFILELRDSATPDNE